MADQTASVRLTLNDRGFASGFNRSASKVEDTARRVGGSIGQHLSAGVEGGLKSVSDLGSRLRDITGTLTTIVGAAGFAGMTKQAIDSGQRFKQIATNIEIGTQHLTNWRDLQREIQGAALKTHNSVDSMASGLQEVFEETGDQNFASASMEKIGTVARQTGNEVMQVAKVAGVLQQKFGFTADDIGDGLAQVVASANQGGASFEDLADDLGEIGGKARTLGAQGPEGLRQMLGFLNRAKEESGNFQQAMTALPQIFDQIVERTSKGMVTSAGKIPMKVQAVDKSGNPRPFPEIIADIIKETKGDAAALGEFGFSGEGLQTVLGLAKDYRAELETTGGDITQARNRLAQELSDAAGATASYADIQRKAGEKTAADNIQTALTKLEMAFQKPQMVAAIEGMAKNLPALADGIATLMDFVLNSPLTAGALYVGGTFAGGALKSTILSALTGGGTAAATSIGDSMAAGGASAGGAIGAQMIAAGAVAVAAWASAGEQFMKLLDELDTHDEDVDDERENILQNAENIGDSYAVREKSEFERTFSPEPYEYIVRGPDGQPKVVSAREAGQTQINNELGANVDVADATDRLLGQGRSDTDHFLAATFGDDEFGPRPPAMLERLPGQRSSSARGATSGGGDEKQAAAVKQLAQETRSGQSRVAQAIQSNPNFRISNWHEMPKGAGYTPR